MWFPRQQKISANCARENKVLASRGPSSIESSLASCVKVETSHMAMALVESQYMEQNSGKIHKFLLIEYCHCIFCHKR